MDWLRAFRMFKRIAPNNAVIDYDWKNGNVNTFNSVEPFVTVREDLLFSQVQFARVLLGLYASFVSGLARIYGEQFANLVRDKCEADIYGRGKFGTERCNELDSMIRDLCEKSLADEDQFDRHRVMKFCHTLEVK